MKTKAAVAWKAGAPLTIEELDLQGPREGEVLVEIKATGICHTDYYTLSGADPEGLFPAVLGHEGAGVVVDTGPGVKSLRAGDHVIPLYTPECRECKFCLSRKTNLCQKIRATQGKGLMPDGSARFSLNGQPVLHYMGTSTFSNYVVVPEIALAKILANGGVILLAVGLSLWLVVHLWLQVPLAGSVTLFMLGTALYLFAVTALGIMLATLTSSMPQFGLLAAPVYVVLYLLSGAATPVESMPLLIQHIVQLSPATQFVKLTQAVLYRGAGVDIVWPQLLAVAAAGALFLSVALARFRSMLARQG